MASTSLKPANSRVNLPELISLQDAAVLWDISEKSMRRYIADGLVPAYRLPGRDGRSRLIRIKRADLEGSISRVGALA